MLAVRTAGPLAGADGALDWIEVNSAATCGFDAYPRDDASRWRGASPVELSICAVIFRSGPLSRAGFPQATKVVIAESAPLRRSSSHLGSRSPNGRSSR